jgi:hypothetical protein
VIGMNKSELMAYLEGIDGGLKQPAMLYIYGSAVCILLDEPDRTSLDIDVAGPYSDAVYGDIVQAARNAGIPVNPDEQTSSNHIEWIQALRLCLPKPSQEGSMVLWQGEKLTIKTASVPELIASKLIRYDTIDQGDIQYLCSQSPLAISAVESAVRRLPPPFNTDALVLENLENLRHDLEMWTAGEEP